jgi:hypothetical protein
LSYSAYALPGIEYAGSLLGVHNYAVVLVNHAMSEVHFMNKVLASALRKIENELRGESIPQLGNRFHVRLRQGIVKRLCRVRGMPPEGTVDRAVRKLLARHSHKQYAKPDNLARRHDRTMPDRHRAKRDPLRTSYDAQ